MLDLESLRITDLRYTSTRPSTGEKSVPPKTIHEWFIGTENPPSDQTPSDITWHPINTTALAAHIMADEIYFPPSSEVFINFYNNRLQQPKNGGHPRKDIKLLLRNSDDSAFRVNLTNQAE